MPNTSVTADSSLTGVRVTPVAFSTFSVADPHGTCGAHTTTWVPGRARSAKDVIFFGLPNGVTIVRVLVAKSTGVPAMAPASTALVMFAVSAEANTSAGAPWVSWVTRSDEPAKLKVTFVPGWSCSNRAPSSVNVFFNDAAANTMSCASGCAESVCDDEHPVSRRARANSPASGFTMFLREFR